MTTESLQRGTEIAKELPDLKDNLEKAASGDRVTQVRIDGWVIDLNQERDAAFAQSLQRQVAQYFTERIQALEDEFDAL